MQRLLPLHLLLLLQIFISPGFPQFNQDCTRDFIGEWQYSHLFSKLEEALLQNKTTLNLLRQIFMGVEKVEIYFSVQLEVVNGTDLSSSCDNDPFLVNNTLSSFDTFCPSNSSDYKWKLCNNHEKYGYDSLVMTYISQSPSKISKGESEMEKQQIDVAISWMSLLHGNILSTFLLFVPYLFLDFDGSDYFYDWGRYDTSLTLVMERLDCNPSLPLTLCALSELLSWVSKLLKIGSILSAMDGYDYNILDKLQI